MTAKSPMLLAALGNPGPKYARTRHNAGWLFVDHLQDKWPIRLTNVRFDAQWGEGEINGQPIVIALPQTYMNLSGRAIRPLAKHLNIPPQAIIAVYDEVALPLGRVQLRRGGSAGGHNGVKSLIADLATQEFLRLRLGVGPRPEGEDLVEFVLGKFKPADLETLQTEVFPRALAALETLLADGQDKAMQIANQRPTEAKP